MNAWRPTGCPNTMNNRRTRLMLTAATIVILGGLAAAPALAANKYGIVPKCAVEADKNVVPTLTCAIQTFTNIAQLILGIVGGLVLLMFVYGGFTFLISGGDSAKVEKGKTIIKNALTGLVIIFFSGMLLNYAVSRLVTNTGTSKGFQPIGASCSDDNTVKATGTGLGIFILMPDGKTKCVKTCDNAGDSGQYKCYNKTAPPNGVACFSTPDCNMCCGK